MLLDVKRNKNTSSNARVSCKQVYGVVPLPCCQSGLVCLVRSCGMHAVLTPYVCMLSRVKD